MNMDPQPLWTPLVSTVLYLCTCVPVYLCLFLLHSVHVLALVKWYGYQSKVRNKSKASSVMNFVTLVFLLSIFFIPKTYFFSLGRKKAWGSVSWGRSGRRATAASNSSSPTTFPPAPATSWTLIPARCSVVDPLQSGFDLSPWCGSGSRFLFDVDADFIWCGFGSDFLPWRGSGFGS